MPNSTYEIQVVDCEDPVCLVKETFYSAPLSLETAVYGDTVRNCGKDPCGPPDGPPVSTDDILAVLKKFGNVPGAPRKARADMEPRVLDLKINVSDALQVINGFSGVPYPFVPSTVTACPTTE